MTASSERFQKMILNALREQTEAIREQTASINRLAEINLQMVEALADEGAGNDAPPAHYLDGTPRNSGGYQPDPPPMHSLPEKPPPREL
ncbi:hypothetical protein [uncultured Kushneria sp.]|uniref:hypothetical protein n=1 Tax=uncultured Kushneria sp. TaxID=905033 RepID=UPI00261E4C41|nr:hypothetical protein [uncultured Kushneria sp.]